MIIFAELQNRAAAVFYLVRRGFRYELIPLFLLNDFQDDTSRVKVQTDSGLETQLDSLFCIKDWYIFAHSLFAC